MPSGDFSNVLGMAKNSGGTRNYRNNPKALSTRRREFEGLMNSGFYDISRSYFDPSGGFVATNKEHNEAKDPEIDKEKEATLFLANKGYKVYLDSERATIEFEPHNDGRIYNIPMDIKTINFAGKHTIKRQLEKASTQNVKAVVLYQNNPLVNKNYVKNQIYGENGFIQKSPKKALEKIDWIIVVGSNGHVHRHDIRKEKAARLNS